MCRLGLTQLSGKGICIVSQAKRTVSSGNHCSGVVRDPSAFHGSADPGFFAVGSICIFHDVDGTTCVLVSFQSFTYIA